MNLRTTIEVPPASFFISHADRIQVFGSCFAEHIGELLRKNKFEADCNPYGVLYNPLSIKRGLELLIHPPERAFYLPYLVQREGRWVSMLHHSDFSASSKETLLDSIVERNQFSSDFLFRSNRLIITFGTSYVYRSRLLDSVVANCHKFPAREFDRYRLSVNSIVDEWEDLLTSLFGLNGAIQIIFTVSPIRHWKDGAHDNQLSKSILLLAIDELCRKFPGCIYFPSYELMMDDLRDYRFYAEDMNHPSTIAIQYIWDKFSTAFFDKYTLKINEEWERIAKALNHRPFSTETSIYRKFLLDTIDKLNRFAIHYPQINVNSERDYLTQCLYQKG